MSRLPPEIRREDSAPLRRQVARLLGRSPSRTVFVRDDGWFSYAPGEAQPRRFAAWADWCAEHAGANVRLVVSGALTHQLIAAEDLPLDDEDSVEQWARHQLRHYHGAAAARWPVAPWSSAGQRGASALHGLDLASMLACAERLNVNVRAVQPWWSVALRAAARRAPALDLAARAELWLVEGSQATRVACAAGRVHQIDQRWLDEPSLPALNRALAELSSDAPWVLGYGIESAPGGTPHGRTLGVLNGIAPAAEWLAP